MSYTAPEFSHTAKKWLLLPLQKYRGKTLHQSFWGEIRGIESWRSHSELRKHQIVEEEDICVVSTKNLSIVLLARCHSHCVLNDGMYAETLKIHSPKASEVSSSITCSYSKPMIISSVSLCVRLKFLFLKHFQPAISTVYGFLFSASV